MKTYGIYLAYPPGLDLEAEGLGRHLVAFLDESRSFDDVRFVIACSSWTRAPLRKLLDGAGLSLEAFELIGPETEPFLLASYDAYKRWRSRPRRRGWFGRTMAVAGAMARRAIRWMERRMVSSRNPVLVGFAVLFGAIGLAAGGILLAVVRSLRLAVGGTLSRRLPARLRRITTRILATPQSSSSVFRLYRAMEEVEAETLRRHIAGRKDIRAWYCPTAFWPHFNLIEAPRLTCVPDVVLSDFPVGFAALNGDRFLDVFRSVEATIAGGDHFVTYSEAVKSRTLVERYHVDPSRVTVVPHGANRLDRAVVVTGFPDNAKATDALCQNLVTRALGKAEGRNGAARFDPRDVKFIFYASQIRPNKNVISLLRAYEFLLRRRYIGHKLILTGRPSALPEVDAFIRARNLEGDVICLHRLSEQELAACYRLADLAVNPSLSEGGCPFTLTEALSVGTPVVMARIAVTEEVVVDSDLQDLMLFDPYDWQDMASRIAWALDNREMLLERQIPLYDRLAQRSWRAVVGEHIAILDRISSPATSSRESRRAEPAQAGAAS